MGFHKKTIKIIEMAKDILSKHNTMTVRQVYYQLVSRQIIENSKNSYNGLCNASVKARQKKIFSWDWIDDRLRRPRNLLIGWIWL